MTARRTTPVAFTEYASRPAWLTYGVTVSPVNSTGTNGAPPGAGGSTGCCAAGDLDLDRPGPRLRVGVDDLHHPQRRTGRLVVLLDEPVPLDRSKSRTGSNSPAANTPSGKTVPESTGIGP